MSRAVAFLVSVFLVFAGTNPGSWDRFFAGLIVTIIGVGYLVRDARRSEKENLMTTTPTIDLDEMRARWTDDSNRPGGTIARDDVMSLLDYIDEDRKVDREQMLRIIRAFAGMPYGAIAYFARPSRTPPWLTFEQIAENLERFQVVLEHEVQDRRAEQEELGKYRRLSSAVRDVVGLFSDQS